MKTVYCILVLMFLMSGTSFAQSTVTLNVDPATANTVTFDPDMSPSYFSVAYGAYSFALGQYTARTVTISTDKKIDVSRFYLSYSVNTQGVSLKFYSDGALKSTKAVNNGAAGWYTVSGGTYVNRIDIVSDGSSNGGAIDLQQIEFTISALAAPSVTTNAASSVSVTTATLNGNATSDGGSAITSRGFEYSTTNGFGTGAGITVTSGSGTGTFNKALTGLTGSTAYYYKAFATNSVGTTWGAQQSFTTNNPPVPEISISGNGTVISDGDASPSTNDHTDFGAIAVDGGAQVRTFTITNSGTGNLTLTNPSPYVAITGHTSDFTLTATPSSTIASGGGTTTFNITFNPTTTGTRSATITIANDDADENPYNFDLQGVGYVSPSVTTNAIANIMTTQAQITGEITATGGQNATTRGVAINTSGTPTTADAISSENGSYGTGTFNLTPNTLTSNTLYYVRAYATNGNGTSYGNEMSFTTAAVVVTSPATSITAIGASVSSEITVGGAAAISAKGICWNTTGTPTTADDKTSDGTGTGVFSSSMTGLNPGTTYFVRAYATNAGGTSYSNQISFTTEELSVTISNVVKNTDTEYQLTADIYNPTSEPILAKGYVWSTSQNPTISANSGSTSNGTGSSSFTDNATITVGPGYFVRAYITTVGGTFYSEQIHFGVVPTLPEWGLIFLAAGFVLGGGWFMYRRII